MSGCDTLLAELGLNMERHGELVENLGRTYREKVLSQPDRPASMAYFDSAIHELHGDRIREIFEARAAGRKMIGAFCIYVPEEIVLAAGAIPVALCGGTAWSIPYAEQTFPREICPLVKSTLGLAFSDTCPFAPLEDLAVGETTCDAKKKTWDILGGDGFHVLHLPHKKTDAARRLWLREVRAFAGRVEHLTGVRITARSLGQAARLMNRKRRLLGRLAGFQRSAAPPISGTDALVVMQVALVDEPQRFCGAVARLLEELRRRVRQGVTVARPGAKRVLLAGCPAVAGNYKVHHVIESSGALVVANESCTGSRYFEHPVDARRRTRGGLLAAIADRYFRIDCSCFTPNDERVRSVVRMARRAKADAVVQYVLQYCHTYNMEAVRIAEALQRAGLPSLTIGTDYADQDTGQIRTRVEALIEGLRS